MKRYRNVKISRLVRLVRRVLTAVAMLCAVDAVAETTRQIRVVAVVRSYIILVWMCAERMSRPRGTLSKELI